MKLIVRMPNWLGDFIMALPLLESLEDFEVDVLGPKAFLELLSCHPQVNQCLPFEKGRRLKKNYDWGILTPNSFSSAWHFFRNGVKNRIGFCTDKRGWLLNRGIAVPKEKGKEHLVETYQRLLAPLGISPTKQKPKLFLPSVDLEFLELPTTPFVVVHPHAAFGPAKCWPAEYYREMIQALYEEHGLIFLLIGSEKEKEALSALSQDLDSHYVRNLAGSLSIVQLAQLIQKSSLFIGNDSGPMHLAAALECPLIALFGSTEPVVTAPYKHGIVLQNPTFCAPCFKRVCPIDFRCMRGLSVKSVVEEAKRQLGLQTASPLHIVTY